MSGKQVVTKCEGSLQYDEESSESEEEGSVGGRSSEQAPLVFEQDSDDEEELEVFGGVKKGQPRENSNTAMQDNHAAKGSTEEQFGGLSLLSAMESSVRAIENEAMSPVKLGIEDESFARMDAALQKAEALKKKDGNITFDFSSNNDSAMINSDESADAFGISYKPFMKKKNDYELPKGPAFEDEAEFERELLSSSMVSAPTLSKIGTEALNDASDDEFDFESVELVTATTNNNNPGTPSFNQEALRTTHSAEKSHESALEEDTDKIVIESNQSQKEDFRKSSQKALEEIRDVYSSGLGDHEVTLLTTQENEAVRSDKIQLDMSKVSVIEEVDEEELEKQEEEQEKLEQDAMMKEKKRRDLLMSEWENIDSSSSASTNEAEIASDYISVKYSDVETFFRQQNLDSFRDNITIDAEQSSSWSLFKKSSKLSAAKLPREVIEFPFLIAQIEYSFDIPEHLNFLRNIYRALTRRTSFTPPPQGGHWESIGFQGLDPATDLNRSMKMLSIVQVIHMIETEPFISQSLYSLSLGTASVSAVDSSWPFMCVAIGMTKNSIDALRSGVLTKDAIKYNSTIKILHEYHHACFHCFMRCLMENPNVHHAEHLNMIRKEVANNPLALLRAFRSAKGDKSKSSISSKGKQESTLKDSNMLDVGADNAAEGTEHEPENDKSHSSRKTAYNVH